MGVGKGAGKVDKISLLQALKSLVVVVGGGVESDYSVCPRPFLQFFQFMSVYVRQVKSGYARLHQVTSVYVSLRRRDGTWSSTTTVILVATLCFQNNFHNKCGMTLFVILAVP